MKLLQVCIIALASMGVGVPQLTARSINEELEGDYCAAASRATWPQFSEWSKSVEQIALEEALDEVVCNVGNYTLNQEIPGSLLHMVVRYNNDLNSYVENITEYLLGTVSSPLNDPNRRRIFISLILDPENEENLFQFARYQHANDPGRSRALENAARYLCRTIESNRIEELFATRLNECSSPPFDLLDQ